LCFENEETSSLSSNTDDLPVKDEDILDLVGNLDFIPVQSKSQQLEEQSQQGTPRRGNTLNSVTPRRENTLHRVIESMDGNDLQNLSGVGKCSPVAKAAEPFPNEPIYQNNRAIPDLIIPKDWMMSFDSPHKVKSKPTIEPKIFSLIDTDEPMLSPKSILKYNERDLEKRISLLKIQYEKESQMSQDEILDQLQTQKKLEAENIKMKDTLFDWEKAIQTMIQDREREKQESDQQMKQISKIHETLTNDKQSQMNEIGKLKQDLKSTEFEMVSLKKVMFSGIVLVEGLNFRQLYYRISTPNL
jgi:hypothetical protein